MARVSKTEKSKKEPDLSRRRVESRLVKQSFLIICEGENTEPEYFNSFRRNVPTITIKPLGTGYNTLSLVKEAIRLKEELIKKGNEYDQYWCVFDKDSFSKNDFNRAIKLAKDNGFKVAYSNQAFELWFILHFIYLESKIQRSEYEGILTKHLKEKYSKDKKYCLTLYDKLYPRTQTAIDNAERLYNIFSDIHASPADEEPSTTVFKLVKEIRKFI